VSGGDRAQGPATARDFTEKDPTGFDAVVQAATAYAMVASSAQIEKMLRDAYGDSPPGSAARWLDQNRPGWRDRTCLVEGCGRAARARGWCGKHYERWRRWGDPQGTPPPKVIPTNEEILAEMQAALDRLREEVGG